MMEHENVPGVVESLKIMTDQHAERLCRFSYEWARANGRKKVTLIHKANIMKVTDGLFLEVCRRVAKDYPGHHHQRHDHRQLLHAAGVQPLAVRRDDPH